MDLQWKQFQMFEDDPSDSGTWISGIYKVRSYSAGMFYAYYMRDGDRNWGWNVSTPPCVSGPCRYWPTLESAQAACEDHARNYKASARTIKRASEIQATFFQLAA